MSRDFRSRFLDNETAPLPLILDQSLLIEVQRTSPQIIILHQELQFLIFLKRAVFKVQYIFELHTETCIGSK